MTLAEFIRTRRNGCPLPRPALLVPPPADSENGHSVVIAVPPQREPMFRLRWVYRGEYSSRVSGRNGRRGARKLRGKTLADKRR